MNEEVKKPQEKVERAPRNNDSKNNKRRPKRTFDKPKSDLEEKVISFLARPFRSHLHKWHTTPFFLFRSPDTFFSALPETDCQWLPRNTLPTSATRKYPVR